jgi:hypothetical protein
MNQMTKPGNGNPPDPLICHRMTQAIPVQAAGAPNAKVIGLSPQIGMTVLAVPCQQEKCANWYVDIAGEVPPGCADLRKVHELQQIAIAMTALANGPKP